MRCNASWCGECVQQKSHLISISLRWKPVEQSQLKLTNQIQESIYKCNSLLSWTIALCRKTIKCNRVQCRSRPRHFQWWQVAARQCNYCSAPPCDASKLHCSAFIEVQQLSGDLQSVASTAPLLPPIISWWWQPSALHLVAGLHTRSHFPFSHFKTDSPMFLLTKFVQRLDPVGLVGPSWQVAVKARWQNSRSENCTRTPPPSS